MTLSVFARSQSGFSLLETVIAIGVLGIIAPALVLGLATGVKVLSMTDIRETARDLAESQMESVQRQSYDDQNDPPLYDVLGDVPSGFAVALTSTPLDQGSGTDNDTGIQHIHIEVSITPGTPGAKPIFVLDGQKVKW